MLKELPRTHFGLGMTRIDHPDRKAESNCLDLPYDTQLALIDGVEVLFWIGDLPANAETNMRLSEAKKKMKRRGVCVHFVYCEGHPSGYWANEHVT